MNAFNRTQRDAGSANKKPYFNFRSNLPLMHRMPAPASPSMKFGGSRQVMKAPETPLVLDNRHGSVRFPNRPITHEEGYASAMEPMDCEDWGDEVDYWDENAAYEVDPNTKNWKSYGRAPPRGSFLPKLVKTSGPSGVHSIPRTSGKCFPEKPPLRQSVLKVDNSSGLSFKLMEKKPPITLLSSEMHEKKLFPKWSVSDQESKANFDDKDGSFPRFLTVTVERLIKWPKKLTGSKIIFELYGILEGVTTGKYPRSKKILLKSETSRDRLAGTFYEIDRALPVVEKGQWQRCIVLFRSNGEIQCLQIRSATSNELKNLDKRVTSSSKAKALLLKTTA